MRLGYGRANSLLFGLNLTWRTTVLTLRRTNYYFAILRCCDENGGNKGQLDWKFFAAKCTVGPLHRFRIDKRKCRRRNSGQRQIIRQTVKVPNSFL